VGRDVGKWCLLKKNLKFTETVKDLEEYVEWRKNSCPDEVAEVFLSNDFQFIVTLPHHKGLW